MTSTATAETPLRQAWMPGSRIQAGRLAAYDLDVLFQEQEAEEARVPEGPAMGDAHVRMEATLVALTLFATRLLPGHPLHRICGGSHKDVFGAPYTARLSLCERFVLPVARRPASREAKATG